MAVFKEWLISLRLKGKWTVSRGCSTWLWSVMMRLICGQAIRAATGFSSSDELWHSSVGKSSNEAKGAGPKRLCREGYEPRLVLEVGVADPTLDISVAASRWSPTTEPPSHWPMNRTSLLLLAMRRLITDTLQIASSEDCPAWIGLASV